MVKSSKLREILGIVASVGVLSVCVLHEQNSKPIKARQQSAAKEKVFFIVVYFIGGTSKNFRFLVKPAKFNIWHFYTALGFLLVAC